MDLILSAYDGNMSTTSEEDYAKANTIEVAFNLENQHNRRI